MINYKCGEFVTFHVGGKEYKYQVLSDRLHFISGNTSIWNALSIMGADIIEFCEKAFGYPPHHVTYYNMGDYDAASRLIHAIREECESANLRDEILKDNTAVASCKGVTTDYKYGDYVSFYVHGKQCTYQVCETGFKWISGASVLDELHLRGKELKAFCEKARGYPVAHLSASYKQGDYAAASRLIKAIEEACAKETYHNRKPEEIISCKGVVEPTIEASHVGRPEEVTSRPKPLKYKKGDEVIFKVRGKSYKYEVYDNFLCCKDICTSNDIIFKALNIETPVNFCTAAYGYAADPVAGEGSFPECFVDDIAALNRVIEALQTECDHANDLHETYGYGTPSKEFMEECKWWDKYQEERDNAKDKDALLTVRKSNTCKF